MRHLLIVIFLLLSNLCFAQDSTKTVTLLVSGSGKTRDVATQSALRSAIEQAFGAFISSKTELLNDKLIKDEIVSISNGNIQKYDVVSEAQMPDGGIAISLKAVVSVSKLTSFCESKGVVVEFKGGVFAANIRQQQLNEQAELIAIKNLCDVSKKLLSKSVEFDLKIEEPISYPNNPNEFIINITVNYHCNKNQQICYDYFLKTLSEIAMKSQEVNSYITIQKKYFEIYNVADDYNKFIHLRNIESINKIKQFLIYSNKYIFDFMVFSEIDTLNKIYCESVKDFKCVDRVNVYDVNLMEAYENFDRWNLDNLMPILNIGTKHATGMSILVERLQGRRKGITINNADVENYCQLYFGGDLDLCIYPNLTPTGDMSIKHKLSLTQLEKITRYKVVSLSKG